MKLFLDDMRCPSECALYMHRRIGKDNPIYLEGEWFIVRNYDQFCKALIAFCPYITHVSFDHDLADEHYAPEEHWDTDWHEHQEFKEKTGYDCAVFLKEFYDNRNYPIMYVHSMDPIGTQRIINLFK